jgi:hypothetical protein
LLRRSPKNAGKRGVPDRLEGGIVSLAFLESQYPVRVVALRYLDLLHLHLKAVEIVASDGEA